MTAITIPAGVTSIGDIAFCYCSALTSIDLPGGVISIGESAFSRCSNLTAITIPAGVTSIGDNAFYKCSGLTSITCLAAEPPACGTDVFTDVNTSTCTLIVPTGSKNAYAAADEWKNFNQENIVEEAFCATPDIAFTDGKFAVTCATPGSICHYTYTFTGGSGIGNGNSVEPTTNLVVTAYATAKGYSPSGKVAKTFSLEDLGGSDGDLNGDGVVDVSDLTKLVGIILGNQ